jgi:hypothetical protein
MPNGKFHQLPSELVLLHHGRQGWDVLHGQPKLSEISEQLANKKCISTYLKLG